MTHADQVADVAPRFGWPLDARLPAYRATASAIDSRFPSRPTLAKPSSSAQPSARGSVLKRWNCTEVTV
jgi:hypothetical protein